MTTHFNSQPLNLPIVAPTVAPTVAPIAQPTIALALLLASLATALPAQAQTGCWWEGGALRCGQTTDRYDNTRNGTRYGNDRYDRDRYDRDQYDRDRYNRTDRYDSTDRYYQRNSSVERDIDRLYQEVLGRSADSSGLDTYSRQVIQNRWSLSQVRRDLANSRELDDAINRVYQEVLARSVDPDGLRTYRNRIQRGASLADVRRELSQSDEARSLGRRRY